MGWVGGFFMNLIQATELIVELHAVFCFYRAKFFIDPFLLKQWAHKQGSEQLQCLFEMGWAHIKMEIGMLSACPCIMVAAVLADKVRIGIRVRKRLCTHEQHMFEKVR